MINAEVTARTGAADATGAVRGFAGKQGGEGDKSGFSDALSSAGGGSRKHDDSTPQSEAEVSEAAPEAAETPLSKGRNALELTARVLFGKAEEAGRGSASVKDVLVEGKVKAKPAQAEDAVIAPSDAKSKIDAAAASKAVKSEKASKAQNTEVDVEHMVAGTDDTALAKKDGSLSEVLSLLAGGVATETVANTMPKQGGPVRERGEKTVASATEARGAQASSAAKASDALDLPTGSDAALVDERTFRLSSGRGTGQSLDMKIGTDEQGKAGFETNVAGNGAAENVIVLDSRRFLGFGQSANGAALTAAMSDDKTWAAAMTSGASLGDPLASSTSNVVNTLKLQLNPHDLGSVTATLRLTGETLNVHLTVENHAAYRQLNDDSSGMIEALRSQGFSVDQVTISVASTSQSDTSSQQQQQGQQSGQAGQQQTAAHDGRQGNGAREQAQGNARSMADDSARGTNEPVSDTVAAGNARPDQLYL